MRSVPMAITWDMLRRGRFSIVFAFLFANLLPMILYASMLRVDGMDLHDNALNSLHTALLLVNIFVICVMVVGSYTDLSRLYTLPTSNATIVAWYLFVATIVSSLEVFLSVAAINTVFKLRWPLWEPTIFAIALVTALMTAFWFSDKSPWLLFVIATLGLGLGSWFLSRFVSSTSILPGHTIFVDVAIMLIVVLVSYFVAVAAVTRNRCGEQFQSLGIFAGLVRVFEIEPAASTKFHSPNEAQFWFEWRKKGWAFPAVVAFATFLGLSAWVIFSRDPKGLIMIFFTGGFMLSMAGMILGMVFGTTGARDGSLEMGHFLASRPLTNTSIAKAILKMTAKSVLISWGMWIATFGVVLAIMLLMGITPQFPADREQLRWWHLPASLVACWTVVATTASIGLTGRIQIFGFIFGAFAVYVTAWITGASLVSKEMVDQASTVSTAAIAIGLLLLTAWVYFIARNQKLIGTQTVTTGLAVWLIMSAVIVSEATRNSMEPIASVIILAGLASLTVFPLAAAPLAVSWNRTR